MAELMQDGVRTIAARIVGDVARDVDHEIVNDQMGSLLDESDFTGPEWERAVRAIADAIASAKVTTGWPVRCRGCGQGIASTPVGWASIKQQDTQTLVLACPAGTEGARHEPPETGPAPSPGDRVVDGGEPGTLVRCVECSGSGLLHQPDELPESPAPRTIEERDAEPFVDRDRWHPVLLGQHGEVEPDPDRYFAAMAGYTDYADESALYEVEPEEMRVRVARRSALPTRTDDGTWQSPGTYNSLDVAREFGDNGMDEFEELDDAKAAWLDAVAVAAFRNQRAGAE